MALYKFRIIIIIIIIIIRWSLTHAGLAACDVRMYVGIHEIHGIRCHTKFMLNTEMDFALRFRTVFVWWISIFSRRNAVQPVICAVNRGWRGNYATTTLKVSGYIAQ